MLIGLSRLVFVNLVFAVISFAVAGTLKAQDAGDLYEDSHFREEQGVNEYTAPSIEKLFEMLDSLKPIPDQELTRTQQPMRFDNRVKYALSFGVLIGDGFLAVEEEDTRRLNLWVVNCYGAPRDSVCNNVSTGTASSCSNWPSDPIGRRFAEN